MAAAWSWFAGAASRDITPRPGSLMAAFPTLPGRIPRRATGAHDPCLATALVLGDGQRTVAVCSIDVALINACDVAFIRQLVAARVPRLAADQVVIAATHTHSSPETS